MKTQITKDHVKIWLSANETYNWAHRPNRRWPCSTLSNHKVFAEFDSNGLLDITIDGKSDFDCVDRELSAMCADFLCNKLPEDHPCFFVIVGQFLKVEK